MLAFAGPNCTKYTYHVMHFGSDNRPVIFIPFIHDMDSTWKALAISRGVVFDPATGTRIIMDDIFSLAPTIGVIQLSACPVVDPSGNS